MVTLTEKAIQEVKRLMVAQHLRGVVLRMGVRRGGCARLSYSLEFDTARGVHDKCFEVDGVTVVVDARSYFYLNGTTLDYVRRDLTGGFVFINPNVGQSCGCGSSFTPR